MLQIADWGLLKANWRNPFFCANPSQGTRTVIHRTFPIRLWRRLIISSSFLLVCFLVIRYTLASASSSGPSFIEFESGHVRPLAISPDRQTLFAVNTPNGTLEVFDLTSGMPVFQYRVAVGLEPVAVAARSDTEVWVVNHLSDSVSIVGLAGTPHVVRTLLVGDEPRDIVFAGN